MVEYAVAQVNLQYMYDGAEAANGTITTYLAGTNALENTFSDNAGTANTNPVTLDDQGRATIFLDHSKRYKFVVKNSSGTQIGAPIDGIGADYNASKLETDLSANDGFTKIGGRRDDLAGTSAYTFDVYAKQKRANLVTDFGAPAGGGAIATPLQAAIDNKIEFEIPPGEYTLNSTIKLRERVHIVGLGCANDGAQSGAVEIRWNGASGGTMMQSWNSSDWLHQFQMSNIRFDAGTTNKAATIANFGQLGENSRIAYCDFRNATTQAVLLDGSQTPGNFEHCSFFFNAIGLKVQNGANQLHLNGMSGDDNTTFLELETCGQSFTCVMNNPKMEATTTGKHDPCILLDDNEDCALMIMGGYADTSASLTNFIRIDRTSATNRPKIIAVVTWVNSNYTNFLNDTWDSVVTTDAQFTQTHPFFTYNMELWARNLMMMFLEPVSGMISSISSGGTIRPILEGRSDDSTRILALGGGNIRMFDHSSNETLRVENQSTVASGETSIHTNYNNGSAQFAQVTLGAADSGGAGYKLLRVPN